MSQFKGRGVIQVTGRQHGKSMAQAAYKRLLDDIYNRPIEDLKLSEGTVYGACYHCVEPVGGSWIEMQEWCFTQFGDSGKHIWGEPKSPESAQRWYMNNRKFWFRDEKDRNWFIMRWSR